MELEILRQRIEPLLVSPREHLVDLVEVLTSGAQAPLDRPWQLGRLEPRALPGLEGVWDQVALAVAALLDDQQPTVRCGALLVLQVAPSRVVWPRVMSRFDSESQPGLRSHLLNTAAELGIVAALPYAREFLHDGSAEMRLLATQAIGALGSDKELSLLEASLADSDSDVRRWAALSIGEIGGEAAMTLLVQRLLDPDLAPDLVAPIGSALGTIGESVVPMLLHQLEHGALEFRSRLVETLAPLKDPAIDPLLEELLDTAEAVDGMALAWALGFRGKPRGLTWLRNRLVGESEATTRFWAAINLARLGQQEGLVTLLENYFEPELLVMARHAVVQLPTVMLGQLVDRLADPNPRRVAAAIDILRLRQVERAVPGIAPHLDSVNRQVQAAAACALLVLQPERFKGPVIERLHELTDSLQRLQLASQFATLQPPIPGLLLNLLLWDNSVAIAMVGIELLLQGGISNIDKRLIGLLAVERLRLVGDQAPRDPADNESVFSDPAVLKSLLRRASPWASLLEPARSEMQTLEAEGWRNPSVALCRTICDALAARRSGEALLAVRALYDSELVILRVWGLLTAARISEGADLDGADDRSNDEAALVRLAWLVLSWPVGDREKLQAKLMNDSSPLVRQMLEHFGQNG